MLRSTFLRPLTLGCLLLLGFTAPSPSLERPRDSTLRRMEFEHPSIHLHAPFVPATALAADSPDRADLERLGVAAEGAFRDSAGESWGTLILRRPLLPGDGAGNRIVWADLGRPAPASDPEWAAAAEEAFAGFLRRHARELRIDPDEIVRPMNVTAHRGGGLIQLRGEREVRGLPVRDSRITATISHGNLVLLGVRNWAKVDIEEEPALTARAALRHVETYLEGWTVIGSAAPSDLVILPIRDPAADDSSALRHRLAWVVRPRVEGSPGRWEALVDAGNGTVLAFADRNLHEATRKVSGGVFPVSNDGEFPDGIEQPGWPMPFASVETEAGTVIADSSGHLPATVGGVISTDLTGPFARIDDLCGEILEASTGDIDLGAGPGTNCEVPPGGSPGNTHSARTTFYALNRVKEVARGHLPGNGWLQAQLTAITNAAFSCSAFWNGEVIQLGGNNFGCAAAGEVAGVVDHEWGHGMDDNDANGFISSPAEGIADIYAALHLNTSCIGRGMLPFVCGGYGDPCLTCDGVRDIDWAERTSGAPHDIAWISANCTGSSGSPCGRTDHCESAVYSEAVWDLYRRTLPAPPFDFDANTSLEIATRLTYLGAGAVGDWYTCNGGGGSGDGCNADGGYLNYLAADDDNGDLADGTPHMLAIFDAFDAHGIACTSPTVQNGGCAGAPTVAPTVTAEALDRSVELSWDPVPGAESYRIFRTEGVFECDFGKARAGETTATSFVDSEVRNDFEVYYTVAAIGPADTCLGPMSACTPATPTAQAGLEITVDGSCPGTVRARVTGATPNVPVALAASRQTGSYVFPVGPCVGTEVDLRQPKLVARRKSNSQGIANFEIPISGSCGGFVQAIDLLSCGISPVASKP